MSLPTPLSTDTGTELCLASGPPRLPRGVAAFRGRGHAKLFAVPLDPLLVPHLGAMNALRFGADGMHGEAAGDRSELAEAAPEVAGTTDHRVPVAGGEITVRIYTPFGSGPFPAHLHLHGGGFWVGMLEQSDTKCRETAQGAGCVVVAVGYRLAPKHKFPVALEDCFTALEWVVANAAELGIDVSRLSVGGVSAGANLATVVTVMARDRGGPPLVFQVLEVPVTDLTLSFPSMTEYGTGYVLTEEACARNARLYLADPDQATDPYASPYFADDLSGLPPALVVTAEFDPVRDEGEAYAQSLEAAGVAVTSVRMRGHVHGSMAFTNLLPSAREHRALVHASLRAAYRQPV
ncbi:MAG: acetyl esterase [Actinomycetota bacterium]|nr:acetyl esterase [Actinomycetota bacterium]